MPIIVLINLKIAHFNYKFKKIITLAIFFFNRKSIVTRSSREMSDRDLKKKKILNIFCSFFFFIEIRISWRNNFAFDVCEPWDCLACIFSFKIEEKKLLKYKRESKKK